MPVFRAAVFGLGGTLVDSLPAATRAFNRVVEPHLGTSLSPGEVRGISGPIDDAMLAKFVPEDWVPFAVIELRQVLVDEAREVRAYAGVHQWLDKLVANSVQLGLLANRDRAWTETIIHGAELGGYFRSIITADDVTKPFPDPVGLLKVANQLGVDPAQTIFVTDNELELQVARKLGFLTAAVGWGYSDPERLLLLKPTVLFEDLSTLDDAQNQGRPPQ